MCCNNKKRIRLYFTLLAVCLSFICSSLAYGQAPKEIDLPVGCDWKINHEQVVYWADNHDITELAENGGIKFIKTGTTLVKVYVKEDGKIYLYQYNVHVLPVENFRSFNDRKSENVFLPVADSIQYAQRVLELVNSERAQAGCRPLKFSDILQNGATVRAQELTQLFSHTRPDGSDCTTVVSQYLGKYWLGENIAAGQTSPEEVVDSWMKSPGHRANILNAKFKEIGVGFAYKVDDKYSYYWVQIFKG